MPDRSMSLRSSPPTNDGVFKSTDRGGSWNAINSGTDPNVYALPIDLSNTSTVYFLIIY